MNTILIPLATGFEEIEAVTLIDVLRRAEFNVITASVDDNLEVNGAHDIQIKCDKSIENINSSDIDMILLPGGWGGTKVLATNSKVQSLLKSMNEENKQISAICAAPYALKQAGVLSEQYTCYPGVQEDINQDGYLDKKVYEENNIITSKGPSTAMCLALYIVKKYKANTTYTKLKNGLLVDFC